MTRVDIRAGDCVITVRSDQAPYPDVLAEMCTRARTLFFEVQAGLPEDDPATGDGADSR